MAKSNARKNSAKRDRSHAYALSSEAVRQRQEHKRGSAAGVHADRRSKRLKTRSDAKRAAISSDW